MKRRISATTRAQAAMICDVGALNRWAPIGEDARRLLMERDFGVRLSLAAQDLAYGAWCAAANVVGLALTDAEAAALLRAGWSPGDAVRGLP